MSAERPSAMGSVISRYLALKRALGRRYRSEAYILRSLDVFLAGCNGDEQDLNPETFAQWCLSLEHLSSGVRRDRMRLVRNLCLYRRRTNPSCFVPDQNLFPPPHQPIQPYIFRESEIARLLQAASRLTASPPYPLRREVFRLAIALLYTTGLRRGELLGLTLSDYDPTVGTLLVRATKFHKSRCLPLSPDGWREIERYLRAGRLLRAWNTREDALLVSKVPGEGKSYTGTGLTIPIQSLLRTAGIFKADGRLPRIHDFRHSFAVQALLRWYRAGIDVQAKLPFLSTYMGHISIASTQHYLHFVESLAHSASARFAQSCGSLVTGLEESQGGSL